MKYTYLALGDSYTIGEGVLLEENFPSQTVALLIKTLSPAEGTDSGYENPQIIAKTGWTTDELDIAIDAANISKTYDIVSLLIGVNNQYRGRSVSEYKTQFDHLLQRAIHFSGNKTKRVFVLSIPDWGVTPFADGQDRQQIAAAIDAYNDTAKKICDQHQVVFIDITTSQRADGNKPEFLTADGLHPSGKEYAKWAEKLAKAAENIK
jgi:lysophospholipase L1-like esterase